MKIHFKKKERKEKEKENKKESMIFCFMMRYFKKHNKLIHKYIQEIC